MQAFNEGIAQYGLPSKIRTDKGTEIVEVARYMLQYRGEVLIWMNSEKVINQHVRLDPIDEILIEQVLKSFSSVFLLFHLDTIGHVLNDKELAMEKFGL